MKNVFRLRDLAMKRIDLKKVGGFGNVGLLGPDQDPDDFSPITPWVMISKSKAKLDFLDTFQNRVEDLELATLDDLAIDVGRAVVGSKFVGTALCTEDMPTCAANQRISPIASLGESLTNADLAVMRSELEGVLKQLDRLER